MSQIGWFTLNRYALAMPKLAAAFRKTDVDVTALLNKNGQLGNTENNKEDTVEISETYKKTDARKKPDTSVLRPETEELVNYVRERALECREALGDKNIPADVYFAFVKGFNDRVPGLERAKILGAKASAINGKMKSGKKLTEEEISFLKEHFPELYMTAKRIEMEIEQLRNQLNNCATQEEKNKLILQKKSQLMSEAKRDPGGVQMMIAAIDEEIKRNGNAGGINPANEDSGADEKDKTRKPPVKPNTATHHYEYNDGA